MHRNKIRGIVSGASSNLPFGEQSRLFIDLTIRLTPPDQIAIEDGPQSRRGEVIQGLRWQQTSKSWKITSERDGRVIC